MGILNYKTLREMYTSHEYDMFISDKLGNDLFINDPDRADRIAEYAEEGCNGSMHCEVIEDWRDFLDNCCHVYEAEEDIYNKDRFYWISQSGYDLISTEIDDCETWHDKNGTLNTIIN